MILQAVKRRHPVGYIRERRPGGSSLYRPSLTLRCNHLHISTIPHNFYTSFRGKMKCWLHDLLAVRWPPTEEAMKTLASSYHFPRLFRMRPKSSVFSKPSHDAHCSARLWADERAVQTNNRPRSW